MSIATRQRTLPADALRRLRGILIALLAIGLGIGAGCLGLVLAPILDRILVGLLAMVLLPVLIVTIVDFFRQPD